MLIKALRIIAFFWIVILCLGTAEYLTFKSDTDFLRFKAQAVQTGWYLPAFYSHIFGSSVILLVGFFQFIKRFQQKKKLHRALGKAYILGVLFFASPGAYIMTLFINRGTGVFLSFLVQNTLWLVFTAMAWYYARKVQIGRHIAMMHRSYALAFAAVTLRFYIWLFSVAGIGIGFQNNYLIIALLSWVPNLLVAEFINYRQKQRVPATQQMRYEQSRI
ncbi:DUF2306 domain-containing protein [Mucilaginibacter sp. Bleaf8]|uniref:DUF2306 domain-containing protein n=1 Tax=Mucilaginibacter sp. Bleaf8 TaxID=2834430 RepID=UPI001BD13661|nr:DUF2306 domain-containing protein [Mucilaginibacter sp. Bleaf8]MBS7565902.1 DUF2306 domain-containing protein [Mucilaginibacter sp. Bleaf8]